MSQPRPRFARFALILSLLAAPLLARSADALFDSGFEAMAPGSLLAGSLAPPDGSVLPADAIPVIAAQFIPPAAGPAAIVLRVDGVDVTALAELQPDRLRYTPASVLPEGPHQIEVTIGTAPDALTSQWAFTTATAPEIRGQTPKDQSLPPGSIPFISANFDDVGAGIDVATAHMALDGIDVTQAADALDFSISYLPVDALSLGQHTATVQVADLAGNESQSQWQFVVERLPEITDVAPIDVIFAADDEVLVTANFLGFGDDIDPMSVHLVIDYQDVTGDADIHFTDLRSGNIQYMMPYPVDPGPHTVLLELSSSDGARAQRVWSFSIAFPRTYDLLFVAPVVGDVVSAPQLLALVKTNSNVSYASEVKINGQHSEVESRLEDGVVFSNSMRLHPGPNTLTATARFADGEERSVTTMVTYDAPPVVTITSPPDWATLGPLVAGTLESTRPMTISGIVSRPVVAVTINQQAATLTPDGLGFTFAEFPLRAGSNLLSANAVDELGRVGTAQSTIYVDQVAPQLLIDGPSDQSLTSASQIDVHGIVNDAIEGGVNAPEPVVEVRNAANAQIVAAGVSDRYFLARDVPLEVGNNVLTVTTTDALGNARSQTVATTRIAAGSRRITLLSGNRQVGAIQQELAAPLRVVAMDAAGLPLVGLPIHFDVLRGSGSIRLRAGEVVRPDGVSAARNLVVNTDTNGQAEVWAQLGNEAGDAGNMIRAWTETLAEEVIFTAAGLRGAPAWVLVSGMSGSQFVATDSQPMEALSAVVLDSAFNAMRGQRVRFQIEEGDARFNVNSAVNGDIGSDGRSLIVSADKNGIASVRPLTGALPGTVRVRAEALVDGAPFGGADFQLMVLERQTGPTGFGGIVMDHSGATLAGVQLSIGQTSLSTMSDSDGKFQFADQVPPGKIDLFVDGTAVRVMRDGRTLQYPGLHFETAVIQGQMNQLPHAIYLPPIDMVEGKIVGGDQDVSLTIPGMDGFEMIVKAHSVTFPDGSHTGPMVVSRVNGDRLPMVPPGGFGNFGTVAWTLQPSGTRFDPPVEVHLPNSAGLARGASLPIVQWDHDLRVFLPMGRGTVSEDGAHIHTDPGTGITKAGWGGGPPPAPPNDACGAPPEPDPEHCKIFQNLVERCPRLESFVPEITITPTTQSPELTKIGANEYSALSDFTYSFTASLVRGDPQFITWATTIKNTDRVTGFSNEAPPSARGASYSFDANINRLTTGSSQKSPPIHFELAASLCGKRKTILVKQDVADIIRQEYADFRSDVPNFTLSVPVRSRLQVSTIYTPNSGLNNPYLISDQISLDDPSAIARAVAAAYSQELKRISIRRYTEQLVLTTDPLERARIISLIQQVGTASYQPTMTSAWRSPRHNRSVNGVVCSNHLKGGAVDLKPSTELPANLNLDQNGMHDSRGREQWCALRTACSNAGYTECLLEFPPSTGAGWNNDHACTSGTIYNAVHSGVRAPCN